MARSPFAAAPCSGVKPPAWRAFKVGDEVTCAIVAIDEQGRIRLSKSEAEAAAERKEAQEYMRKVSPQPRGKGFGTLGDLLREKLER